MKIGAICLLLFVSILGANAQGVPTPPLDQDAAQVPEGSSVPQNPAEDATDTDTPAAEPPADVAVTAKEAVTNPDLAASIQDAARERDYLLSMLPWALLAVAAALAAGLGTWAFMLRRQGLHFEALRQKVLEGGEKLPLLSEEAFKLIADFRVELGSHALALKADADKNLVLAREVLLAAQKDAEEAQQLTRDTVEHFKTSLNGQFEKIGGFMKQIAQSAAGAHETSKVTMEYAQQVGSSLRAKEEEIKELRQGFQKAMLWPLVEGMVTVRDDLRKLQIAKIADPEISKDLAAFDEDIGDALARLQIREFSFTESTDPTQTPSHYWDALPAAKTADDQELHGKVAKVERVGYVIDIPGGNPIVARKALVLRYAYKASVDFAVESRVSGNSAELQSLANAQENRNTNNPLEKP